MTYCIHGYLPTSDCDQCAQQRDIQRAIVLLGRTAVLVTARSPRTPVADDGKGH